MTAPTAINSFSRAVDLMAALHSKEVTSRDLVQMLRFAQLIEDQRAGFFAPKGHE